MNRPLTDEELSKVMPNFNPTAEDVVVGIGMGNYDFYLDNFIKAIQKRWDYIAQVRAQSLRIGDRIVLQGLGMGAKYLNGAKGTVTGFATKNIKVRLDPEVDTRRYSHDMKVPPALLRKINENVPELKTDDD